MNNLPEHVEQSIRARNLFRRSERILVAVSGGVDSMVLLHLLHALAPKFGWELTVAHFNHQLRGRASDGDETFVKRTAKSLGLEAVVECGEVMALAEKRGASIEMAARELRHKFFARTARRLKIRSIALAHHADDQVELFFLRLLRGAGGEGIAGMKWRNPSPVSVRSSAFTRSGSRLKAELHTQLVRPLLNVSKTDLEQFARRNKVHFRQDASNASHDILRNRIRHELLPLLKSRYQSALAKTVLRAMEIIGAETESVTSTAERWFQGNQRPTFVRLSVATQRHCLRLQLAKLNVASDFEMVEQLRKEPNQLVNVSPSLSVVRDPAGLVRVRRQSSVAFNPNKIEIALNGEGGENVFDGVRCRWKVETVEGSKLYKQAAGRELFDADKVGSRIVLRHWRPGDRFRPIGMAGPVKLQDWFMNQKVPRAWRHTLLVAEAACGEIFWIEGQRISEEFKLTPGTRRRLIWCWRRG